MTEQAIHEKARRMYEQSRADHADDGHMMPPWEEVLEQDRVVWLEAAAGFMNRGDTIADDRRDDLMMDADRSGV